MSNVPLHKSATTGFVWNVLGAVFRAVSGFTVNVILSRLLGPEPFGTMAVTLALLNFGTLVLDSGLSATLVQRQYLTKDDINGVQGFQLLVGSILAVAIWLLAYPLAKLFQQPELVHIAPWLAIMIMLTSMLQVPQALLRRRLNFKVVQQAQMFSYLVGYVIVGIVLALQGFGIWSLIVAQLIQMAVNLAWVYTKAKNPFRPTLKGERSLVNFGASILATNLVNWITMNADIFAVGSQFGKSTLGVYNRMNFLLGTPINILTSSIQPIMVSTVARVQMEKTKVKNAYLAVVELVAWVALPLFLSLAFVGHTLVEGIYGYRWVTGIPLVLPISIVMAISSLGMLPGPVLTGLGRVEVELRSTVVNLLVSTPFFIMAAMHSAAFVAWAVVLSRLSFCFLLNRSLAHYLEMTLINYMSRIVRPLSMAFILSIALWIVDHALTTLEIGSIVRLAIIVIMGIVVYSLIFFRFPELLMDTRARQLLTGLGSYNRIRWIIFRRVSHD